MIAVFIIVDEVSYRLDLFNDEQITINSTIQNFKDLAKVFTDFSQTFKIPRSKNNDKIFKHWYDNTITNGFDHRSSYDAYLHVNNELFKYGVITIENVNANDYGITFYGNSININDKFGDLKLKDLDLGLTFSFDQNLTKSIIEGNPTVSIINDQIGYPLFAKNSNKYEYLTGTSYDVTNSNSITWSDLYPAVRVQFILEAVKTLTNIEFVGDFLATDIWQKLFLYYKNSEEFVNFSEEAKIQLNAITGGSGSQPWTIDLVNDKITYPPAPATFFYRQVLEVTPTDNALNYNIIVKKDGVVFTSFNGLKGYNEIVLFDNYKNGGVFTYYWQTEGTNTLAFFTYVQTRIGGTIFGFNDITCNSATGFSIQQFYNLAPDIKIIDFLTGLTKTFNLAIIPLSSTKFELIPIDEWYANGKEIDLTNKVISEIEIKKPTLYKNITFKNEKSENIVNDYFNKTFNRGYSFGDLDYIDENTKESGTYEVKLPFERPIHESYGIFTTATFINKDLQPYTPKPILLYENGLLGTALSGSDRINFSGVHLTNYRRFSNEIEISGVWYSLEFGAEISSYNLSTNLNGLYNIYYKNYIENLYNLRTRVLNLKVKFENNIELNDAIIIRGQRYRINSIKTNLTEMEQDLELINSTL